MSAHPDLFNEDVNLIINNGKVYYLPNIPDDAIESVDDDEAGELNLIDESTDVTEDNVRFIGAKAKEAAEFFQKGTKNNRNKQNFAYETAKRFLCSIEGPGYTSFRHGIISGKKCSEAAEEYEALWIEKTTEMNGFE